jgi:hypothetical protein
VRIYTVSAFTIDLMLQAAVWPWVDSDSNRNEYQESSCGKGRPVRKADNLTAICESNLTGVTEEIYQIVFS